MGEQPEVYMEYSVIESVATGFSVAAATMTAISAVLSGLIAALKVNFLMRIFTEQIIKWMEGIRDALNKLAALCDEFSEDLNKAVEFHRAGDTTTGMFFQGS